MTSAAWSDFALATPPQGQPAPQAGSGSGWDQFALAASPQGQAQKSAAETASLGSAAAPMPQAAADSPQQQGSGLAANAKAGAVEGLTGTVGSIIDGLNPVNILGEQGRILSNAYDQAAHLVTGTPVTRAQSDKSLASDKAYYDSISQTPHKLNQAVGAVTGYNPENTTATTFPERLVRGVSAGATGGLLFPAGEGEGIVAGLTRNATIGAGAGAGSTTAAEVAPEGSKEAAALLGGLAGGGVVGAAESGFQAARAAGVPGVVRNVAAGVSPSAAETAAGRVLASRASDPAATAAALEQPSELVQGSQPTTFQQTGDMGLGSLEREVAAKNPAAFQQRRADQNNARVQALGDIQQGADPNDVAKTLKAHFNDLDQQTQAKVDAAVKGAQDRAAAIGQEEAPEVTGERLRASLVQAQEAREAHDSALWNAVDPDRNLVTNVGSMSADAERIQSEVRPTARPMSGEEAAIFHVAQQMPELSPLQDLLSLRTRVNDAMRDARVNGESQSLARLTQLRGSIQDSLANAAGQAIANEAPAVERGMIEPSQSIAAKVQSEVDAWRAQRATALAGGNGQAAAASGRGAASVYGVPGAESGAAGLAGAGAVGASEVPRPAYFDEAGGQRLAEATASTRTTKQMFGAEPVKTVLASKGMKDDFRLSNGSVAAKFFHPGASGYDHMQALLATGAPDALPTVERYAVTTLRRAAMNEDGTLDPAKYERWAAAYNDARRPLPPEVQARFSDAAAASRTLADVRAARTEALKQAQAGAIGRVMNLTEPQDVTRTVGAVLNSRTAVADMKQLALATKGNPEARAGLRQTVADYVSTKLLGNAEAGTSGVAAIKGDAYQTFIKNARPALHLIFTPEEVRTMEAIAEDIQRSNRSISAVKLPGGSNTTQDILGAIKGKKVPGGHSMMNVLAAVAGEHQGGLLGAAVLAGATHLAQALHGAGVARIDELVTQAMLNPKLAAELLKKAPPKPTPASFRPIAAALVRSVVPTKAATQQR